MKSQRVLARVDGSEAWVGDDLRFAPESGDAVRRHNELQSGYRHIAELRIESSDDEPTHAYEGGHLTRLRST